MHFRTRAAFLLAVTSCVGAPATSSPSDYGDLAVEVFFPDGIVLADVTYRVSGNGVRPITEVVPVATSATSTFALFSNLPAGGYQVAVTAIATDGSGTCAGSANADVQPNSSTRALIHLLCSKEEGKATIVVTLQCGLISSLVAAPVVASVGGKVDLQASASNGTGAATTFAWAASSGTFSDTVAATSVFTCSVSGPAIITLTAFSGQCFDRFAVTVTCVAS